MAASSRARGPIALAVWLAVTASAVAVAWLGMDSVVNAQVIGSPVLMTTVDPTGPAGAVVSADPSGSGAGVTSPTALPSATGRPTASRSPAPPTTAPATAASTPPAGSTGSIASSSPPAASDLHRYTMVGGVVVAQIDGDQVTFVSATPDSGYQVQDWIEDEWLRVDFTEASDNSVVYSLFITWNGYSPQVTETGPNS